MTQFFVETAAAWASDAVPFPTSPTVPRLPAGIDQAGHTCRPWKVVLSAAGGTYRAFVTGGEPPTAPRKAVAVGLNRLGTALFASPLYFNGPFEFAVRQLLLGGTVVLLPRFDPVRWVQLAAATRPDWAFLAPIQIRRLLDGVRPASLADALSSIQTVLHTAAPCPPDIHARLVDLAGPHRVAEFYGAAEYDGTFAWASSAARGALPISGAELRVVDAHRRPVAAGVVGTIEGRSAAGLVGHYADEPCAVASVWRTVGDQGRFSEEGRLTVTDVDTSGRAIVGGVKVALSHIHDVIAAHPAVGACQVIPVPDAEYGQIITVRVRVTQPLTAAALGEHCAARLQAAERPRHIHLAGPGPDLANEDPSHADAV